MRPGSLFAGVAIRKTLMPLTRAIQRSSGENATARPVGSVLGGSTVPPSAMKIVPSSAPTMPPSALAKKPRYGPPKPAAMPTSARSKKTQPTIWGSR